MEEEVALCPGACGGQSEKKVDYVIVYYKKNENTIKLFEEKLNKLNLITWFVESIEYKSKNMGYLLVSAPREVLTARAELAGIFLPIRMVNVEDMMEYSTANVHTIIDHTNGPPKKKNITVRDYVRYWFCPKLVSGHMKFIYKQKYDFIFKDDDNIYDPFLISTRIRSQLVHDLTKDIELTDLLTRENHEAVKDDSEGCITKYRGLEWLKDSKYVVNYFVPHCQQDRKRCKKIQGDRSGSKIQLATWIKEYLGEKVGFFFAWRAAWLSCGLTIPAILGIIFTIADIGWAISRRQFEGLFDNEILPLYGIIALLLQINIFAFGWSRYKYIYGFKWGSLNYFLTREKQFVKLKHLDHLKNNRKLSSKILSLLMGTGALLLFLMYNLACFAGQQAIRNKLIEDGVMKKTNAAYLSTISVSFFNTIFVVFFLNRLFVRFAKFLSMREYHTFHSDYERSLTWKVFFYSFVANTLRLFMMVVFPRFTIQNFDIEFCEEDACVATISAQLVFFLLAKPFTGLGGYFKDNVIYKCKRKLRNFSQRENRKRFESYVGPIDEAKRLDEEFRLYESDRFGERYQTLMDMNDRVLQYALVIMFGGILPLSPAIAFVMEIFIRRVDFKRYTEKQRRPVPRRHEGVGCWEEIVDFVNILAMFTNVWIVVYRTSASKDLFREEPQIGLLLMGGIAVFSYFIRAVTQETSVPEQVKRFQREEMDHAENYLKSANGRRCKRPSKEEAILN